MGKVNDNLKGSCPGAKLIEGKVFKASASKAELAAWEETLSL